MSIALILGSLLFLSRNFIRDKFKATNLNKERNIYPYNTTATDTSLVKNVMGAVQTIIFRAILGEVF